MTCPQCAFEKASLHSTLASFAAARAAATPDAAAFIEGERSVSYAEFDALAGRAAAWLRASVPACGFAGGEGRAGVGAIHAILCDMFVNEAQRGKGLSKWLLECILTHPRLRTVSRFLLGTRDAHELYRKYGGFTELRLPHLWMERTIAGAE